MKRILRCDLLPQYKKYKKEIDTAISRVLNSGIYILGPEVKAFEKEFAEYTGTKHSIGVANGTDALILAIMALDIGPGDEVITTPFTAIPTTSAIIDTGAKPVFVDIEENTFLLDINKVKEKITKKTKAIIPVHIFGNVVDIPRLRKVVGPKIKIIEDACQAHGSTIRDKKAGSMGDISAFSFYPTKNVGGYGDGGAITTNDPKIAEKINLLKMYGMTDKDHIIINGINSRLDEIQAAILRVKLKYLDEMNRFRKNIADRYHKDLPKEFTPQHIPKDVFSNYHVYVSRFTGNRKKLIEYLDKQNIQTNVFYLMPLYLQKSLRYLGVKKGSLPIVEKVCSEAITLPIYPEFNNEDQKFVIDKVNNYYYHNSNRNKK